MCHSVEMYMPSLARQAAEQRLAPAKMVVERRGRPQGLLLPIAAWMRILAGRRPAPIPDIARPVEAVPMIAGRSLRIVGAVLVLALAACAAEPAPGSDAAAGSAGEGPADTQVVDATGLGTDVPSFTVRRQGRPLQVQFYQAGGGIQRVIVTSRSGRGLDRADARTAYDAAFEAAQQLDCGAGQPVYVDADSATFQEDDRRTALTQGAPAWVFRARCG